MSTPELAPTRPKGIRLRFQLTEQEYFRAGQAAATRSLHAHLFHAGVLALPIALGAAIDMTTDVEATLGLPMWSFGAVLGVALLAMASLVAYGVNRRAFRSSALGKGDMTWVLDDNGVTLEGSGVTSSISWQSMHKVVETREFFLFYPSTEGPLILPRRIVTPEAEALVKGAAAAKGHEESEKAG